MRDTAHLTAVEECFYSRMVDQYYVREAPLPRDVPAICRLVRAHAATEKRAVGVVLREFFVETPDGWRQKRCDEELERYADKSEKARKSAYASVESRAERNKQLRADRMSEARAKGTHTAEEWAALVAFCGAKCVKCGAHGAIAKDHIVPVYQGGSDGIDNLQPLCPTCNTAKGPDATDHRPAGWAEVIRSANVQRTLSERSANQNQNHNQNQKDASERSETSEVHLPGNLTRPTWETWKSHLANRRKGVTPQTERLALHRLGQHADPERVVQDAIANGHVTLPPIGGWQDKKPQSMREQSAAVAAAITGNRCEPREELTDITAESTRVA